MSNNRELSQFARLINIDEGTNNNVGIATTVRISPGGLYVDGVEVIGPGGTWKGPNSGLVGAQGAQGAQGYQGVQGEVGAQGTQGAQGYQGRQGTVGAQGTQGAPGAQGNQGRQGSPGSPGAQGAQGAQGRQGAPGVQGDSGTQVVRAWVNFNGQGTVAIRADFNINTVADNGTGTYTINFSSSLPDANYAMGNLCQEDSGGGNRQMNGRSTRTASAMPVDTRDGSNGLGDFAQNTVCFVR